MTTPTAYAPATQAAVDAELARQAAEDDTAPVPGTRAPAHRHGITGSEPPSVADVIAAARATGDAKLLAQADKTEAAVDVLVAMVGEHQALARAEEEVERLAAKLAAAKARVRNIKQGKTTPKTRPAKTDNAARRAAADPKAVRAWAAENGVACNAQGIVRGDVVDAYLAAMNLQEVQP
jgi:hypothetical protein